MRDWDHEHRLEHLKQSKAEAAEVAQKTIRVQKRELEEANDKIKSLDIKCSNKAKSITMWNEDLKAMEEQLALKEKEIADLK